jgi:chromosome segregation ATPase
MTDITQLDELFDKAKELESYIGQSQIVLKTLITAKEDAGTIIRSLSQKQDELTRLQQDISGYLKTLQTISQKAEALLNPMRDQKKELEILTKKVEEGISGFDGLVQQRLGELTEGVETKLKDLAATLDSSVATARTNLDAGIADLLQKQDALAKNISQRIEKGEKTAEAQRAVLEQQKVILDQERKEVAETRKAIQDLKGMLEKYKEDLHGAMAKQKEELNALADRHHQELSAAIKELSDKHVKVLEKDNAQIKSTLNSIISKLENVKFKKLLGL